WRSPHERPWSSRSRTRTRVPRLGNSHCPRRPIRAAARAAGCETFPFSLLLALSSPWYSHKDWVATANWTTATWRHLLSVVCTESGPNRRPLEQAADRSLREFYRAGLMAALQARQILALSLYRW